MKKMTITSFHKNKGSKRDLANDRGVFNLSKIRTILDQLIYEEEYENVDSFLSFANVGGRKKRNMRDHLFIVYSVINDIINGEARHINLMGADIML